MLHPYLQTLSEAAQSSAEPPLRSLEPAAARARVAALKRGVADPDPRIRVRDTEIAGIRVREYVPMVDRIAGTAIYAHSGGWVLGDLDGPDAMLRRMSLLTGLRYLSVDYRLAPEHPHPAALDDVETVLEHAGDGPLVLHGDSAGGNLAAVVAARHADSVALQVLVYPVTDCDLSRPSHSEVQPPGFLAEGDMQWFWDLYIPDPDERGGPDASPLRHVSAHLPPAVIVTAQYDPLRDEGLAYAQALREAGVECEHIHADDCTHGFIQMVGALPPADDTVAAVAAHVRQRVTGSARPEPI